jgi:hypothetical protein
VFKTAAGAAARGDEEDETALFLARPFLDIV